MLELGLIFVESDFFANLADGLGGDANTLGYAAFFASKANKVRAACKELTQHLKVHSAFLPCKRPEVERPLGSSKNTVIAEFDVA